jgi:hypothetical protein
MTNRLDPPVAERSRRPTGSTFRHRRSPLRPAHSRRLRGAMHCSAHLVVATWFHVKRAPGSGLRAPGSGLRAPGSGLRAPGDCRCAFHVKQGRGSLGLYFVERQQKDRPSRLPHKGRRSTLDRHQPDDVSEPNHHTGNLESVHAEPVGLPTSNSEPKASHLTARQVRAPRLLELFAGEMQRGSTASAGREIRSSAADLCQLCREGARASAFCSVTLRPMTFARHARRTSSQIRSGSVTVEGARRRDEDRLRLPRPPAACRFASGTAGEWPANTAYDASRVQRQARTASWKPAEAREGRAVGAGRQP